MKKVNQEVYGKLQWWIHVSMYCAAVGGRRWRLLYDDTFLEDFDHEPTMTECMEALLQWWNKTGPAFGEEV